MRMDEVFTTLARKVSLQLGPESPYYVAPLKMVKRITMEGDEWFADPENPTNEEITKYATMLENHKRSRCEECGKVLPINARRVVKKNPESPEWLCRKCKVALERQVVQDTLVGDGSKPNRDENKVCKSCGAEFVDLPSGNRMRQHTKECSNGTPR